MVAQVPIQQETPDCSVVSFLHPPYQHFNKYSAKDHGYGLYNWEPKTLHPFSRSGKNKRKKGIATVRDAGCGGRGTAAVNAKKKSEAGHRHLD
jgi:hypothetical protein